MLGSLAGIHLEKLVVQIIETRCRVAVKVEPPVADEVLLVEDGAIGAEEGPAFHTGTASTDMEGLTLGFRVRIVA